MRVSRTLTVSEVVCTCVRLEVSVLMIRTSIACAEVVTVIMICGVASSERTVHTASSQRSIRITSSERTVHRMSMNVDSRRCTRRDGCRHSRCNCCDSLRYTTQEVRQTEVRTTTTVPIPDDIPQRQVRIFQQRRTITNCVPRRNVRCSS